MLIKDWTWMLQHCPSGQSITSFLKSEGFTSQIVLHPDLSREKITMGSGGDIQFYYNRATGDLRPLSWWRDRFTPDELNMIDLMRGSNLVHIYDELSSPEQRQIVVMLRNIASKSLELMDE